MGEAKRRGTYTERLAQAQARVEALKPEFLVCNECQIELREVLAMDAHGMTGIEAAFAAVCPICSQNTWAIKGDTAAVARLMEVLSRDSGGAGKMGAIGIIPSGLEHHTFDS